MVRQTITRILSLVSVLALTTVVLTTLVPTASAACVPRGDGQDLVCATPTGYPTGTCVSYLVNPPLPGTATGGWVCQPVSICQQQPAGCVTTFCLMWPKPMCWAIILH